MTILAISPFSSTLQLPVISVHNSANGGIHLHLRSLACRNYQIYRIQPHLDRHDVIAKLGNVQILGTLSYPVLHLPQQHAMNNDRAFGVDSLSALLA